MSPPQPPDSAAFSAPTGCAPITPHAAERVAFLDWARAFFMLLGLPFHAALIYAAGSDWLVNDAAQSHALTWFAATSQMFRMPGFFFIAGYFAALMLAKRGVGSWVQDRARRLLIPLATGLILLNPAQLALSALARPEAAGFGAAFGATIARDPGRLLGHFWFLPTLMPGVVSSVVAAVLVGLCTAPTLSL